MLPVERVERIRQILETKKNVKISELSSRLNVSEMTVHRDIKPLIEDGFVNKTFGGVSLATSTKVEHHESNSCIYCHRPILEKTAYKLILKNQRTETACCAHCGLLRHEQLGEEVAQAICYDFLRQTTISVSLAYYVMDTSLNIGCCQPQVLSFEWEQHANQFVKGFGGTVYPFQDAVIVLQEKMKHSNNSCHT